MKKEFHSEDDPSVGRFLVFSKYRSTEVEINIGRDDPMGKFYRILSGFRSARGFLDLSHAARHRDTVPRHRRLSAYSNNNNNIHNIHNYSKKVRTSGS